MLQTLGRHSADLIASACALLLAFETFVAMEAMANRRAATNDEYYRRLFRGGAVTALELTIIIAAIWL